MSVSGWGVRLIGYDAAIDALESLKFVWNGERLILVGPTVSYAVYQELGTSKMAARPFMRPAAERVKADPAHYAGQVAGAQNIDISTETGFLRAVALAVQNEAKRIADQKDVRDTGDLIASITIEEIR